MKWESAFQIQCKLLTRGELPERTLEKKREAHGASRINE